MLYQMSLSRFDVNSRVNSGAGKLCVVSGETLGKTTSADNAASIYIRMTLVL